MDVEKFFCNPVPFSDGKRHTNPDPFVMRWCGIYYCYATDSDGVKVSISEDLVHWEYKGYAIKEPDKRDYWAPSVFYWNGVFYMYYSNLDREEEDGHKQWLKLAESKNPEGPFVWEKTFFNKFSIDSHPILWNEKLYMFYSVNDWIGTDEKVAGTIILLDEMLSPEQFAGNPKPVLLPTLEQEIFAKDRFGDGRDWYTLEGAATVVHGNHCFLTYSANAYVNVDYFVGTAVAENKENLLDMVWNKYPSNDIWMPLLHKNELVEGTGHNTIVKAPNMVDDWIVYHGRMAKEDLIPEKEQREMRMDPLMFNGLQMICNGPTQEAQKVPQMAAVCKNDLKINQQVWLAQMGKFYRCEYWISAAQNHIGCRYDIYLAWSDAQNYVKLQIHSGRSTCEMIECVNAVEQVLLSEKLEQNYDYTVPHCICVDRKKDKYTVILDEKYRFCDYAHRYDSQGKDRLGIETYFSDLTLHSFAVTETFDLTGKDLVYLDENYRLEQNVNVDDEGMDPKRHVLNMKSKLTKSDYVEEIQLEAVDHHGCVCIEIGEKNMTFMENEVGRYAIYRIADGDFSHLWVNGKEIKDFSDSGNTGMNLQLKNTRILQYCYTKNYTNC